jgi:hypothetical protein
MTEVTRTYGAIDTRQLVFREQFTGNGAATTFQLTSNVGNATFGVGSWDAGQVVTTYPAHITLTDKKPAYDSALPIIRNRISVSSINGTGLVTLDFAPQAENFFIWYWYTLTQKDHLSAYYREDFVASMEDSENPIASGVATDTTNFDGLLSVADDTVQKALDTLDDISLAASGISTDTGAFNAILSATEDTVQKALDILDDHLHTAQTLQNDGITPDSGTLTITGDISATSDGVTITSATLSKPVITLENTHTDNTSPILLFNKAGGSPANDDPAGLIRFDSEDTNLAAIIISGIESRIRDTSLNAEYGSLAFTVIHNGTLIQYLSLGGASGSEIVFNEQADFGFDIDIRFEAVGQTEALFIQGSDGAVGIRNNAPSEALDVTGNIAVSGTVDGVDVAQLKTDYDAHRHSAHTLEHDAVTPNSGTLTITGLVNISGPTVTIGTEDTVDGALRIYGDTSASTLGGQLYLETAADHDTTITNYSIQASSESLWIGPSNNTDFLTLTSTGLGIGETSPDEMLHLTSSTDSKPVIKIENTHGDANSGEIEFLHTSASAVDDDRLGRITFKGLNSAVGEVLYASIEGTSSDVTQNDTAGNLIFRVNSNAVTPDPPNRTVLEMNGYNGAVGEGFIEFNGSEQDFDFIVNSLSISDSLFVQGSDGYVGLGTNAPQRGFHYSTDINYNPIRIQRDSNIIGAGTGFEVFLDNSAGTPFVYARFNGDIRSPTAGNESGALRFGCAQDGSDGDAITMLYITDDALITGGVESLGSYSNDADNMLLFDRAGGTCGMTFHSGTTSFCNIYMADGTAGAAKARGRLRYNHNGDHWLFGANGADQLKLEDTTFTVNQAEIDFDTIISANGITNAFFVQGSDGFVGIGEGTPDEMLHLTSSTSAKPVIKIENTNADSAGSNIELLKTTASPANSDISGEIIFNATHDTPGEVQFAKISTRVEDVRNASYAGNMRVLLAMNATERAMLTIDCYNGTIDQGDIRWNETQQDMNFWIGSVASNDSFYIDGNSGVIILDHSTSIAQDYLTGAWTPNLQVNGVGNGGIAMTQWNTNDTIGPKIWLSKSGSSTTGTHTTVNNNELIGALMFSGSDGTGFINAAMISCNIDSTPSTNDMPGRLGFYTTLDGAASPTERVRIDNAGYVGILSGYLNMTTTLGSTGYGIRDNSGTMEVKNSGGQWTPFGLESEKGWSYSSPQGGGATYYVGGYYDFAASDNDFSTGPTFGTANLSYAAHFFIVLGAATVDELTIRVSGDSIDDNGTRVDTTTEDIVIPNSTAVDTYYETTKKWLGTVTITVVSGTAKTCNYGYTKYWDNANTQFNVVGLESTWLGGATDTGFNIQLYHHKSTGWTFNSGAAPTPPTPLAALSTDHGAGDGVILNSQGAWKRVNLDQDVDGSLSEGTIFQITTTAAKTIQHGNILLRIRNLTA